MSEDIKIEYHTIAQRYASALIDIAQEDNSFDAVRDDLQKVKETFSTCPDLEKFLQHPTIPIEEKKSTVDKIFRSEISANLLNFLKVLLDKNRIIIFSSVCGEYLEKLAIKKNIIKAQVITAIELNSDIEQRVKEKLQKLYSTEVEISKHVDEKIIAGIIVKVNDKVIDGSVRNKLEHLKKQLI